MRGEKITPADVFDTHSERVIAQGRIILCALSLLAIWLDPVQLADSATATKALIVYSALALALLAIPFWKFPGPVTGYLVHATDIGFLATLVILSQARAGPFFAFFAFVILLAAALRWGWQGVLATGAALAVINNVGSGNGRIAVAFCEHVAASGRHRLWEPSAGGGSSFWTVAAGVISCCC